MIFIGKYRRLFVRTFIIHGLGFRRGMGRQQQTCHLRVGRVRSANDLSNTHTVCEGAGMMHIWYIYHLLCVICDMSEVVLMGYRYR